MLDLPSAAERRQTNAGAEFKATAYRQTGAKVFFESSLSEAVQIANLSGRPVYAMDTREMVYPGVDPNGRRRSPLLRNRIAWIGHEMKRKGVGGTATALKRRATSRLRRQ